MKINDILEQKKITKYRLSKLSGVPNATLCDICRGTVSIEKCSAETIYKLAKALSVSMEELLEDVMEKESIMKQSVSFELFKSNVCHHVKEIGDIEFVVETLTSGLIKDYFEQKKFVESLYMLAMVDYLSRENGLPLCAEYNAIRKSRLDRPIYPQSVLALSYTIKDDNVKKRSFEEAIPEFRRFNIVECEVRDVV